MLIIALGMIGSRTALSMGAKFGMSSTIEGAWTAWTVLCATIVPLCVVAMIAEKRKDKLIEADLKAHHQRIDGLTTKYNHKIDQLEKDYKEKKTFYLEDDARKNKLLSTYAKRYQQLKDDYELNKEVFESAFDDSHPKNKLMRRLWLAIIVIGFIAQLAACGYSMGATIEGEPASSTPSRNMTQRTSSAEKIYWNAESIPIPYLTDSTRYVSNPELVVSETTEQKLNRWLKRYDDSLSIETVMIIVNHVENDDPFRMAQDVGNKYGVGRADRGLVIILAYEDHALNISPGRSLEANLTDVECHRLEQQYAIPFLKENQPDSAMLYLTTAMYNLLQHKDMPVIAKAENTGDNSKQTIFKFYLAFFGAWCLFLLYLAHHYRLFGTLKLKANPFVIQNAKNGFVVFDSFSHGGGGGGFGGGGFGGGSFGGGGFGGGGATGRW